MGYERTLGPLTFGKKEEQIFLGREIAQHQDYSEDTALRIDQEVKRIVTDSTAARSRSCRGTSASARSDGRGAAAAGGARRRSGAARRYRGSRSKIRPRAAKPLAPPEDIRPPGREERPSIVPRCRRYPRIPAAGMTVKAGIRLKRIRTSSRPVRLDFPSPRPPDSRPVPPSLLPACFAALRSRLRCPGHALHLGARTLVMGILNVTPDSFADGGRYLDPGARWTPPWPWRRPART